MGARAVSGVRFGAVMADLPSGVAVVTARGAGEPKGLLVTSLTAYSAAPPSLLVSIAHASRSHDTLAAASGFGVHVLRRGQDGVAARFAGRDEDKFAGLAWTWDHEVPQLEGPLAYLRCETSASFAHLDHTILIGTIVDVHHDAKAEPMLYLRRGYT